MTKTPGQLLYEFFVKHSAKYHADNVSWRYINIDTKDEYAREAAKISAK